MTKLKLHTFQDMRGLVKIKVAVGRWTLTQGQVIHSRLGSGNLSDDIFWEQQGGGADIE